MPAQLVDFKRGRLLVEISRAAAQLQGQLALISPDSAESALIRAIGAVGIQCRDINHGRRTHIDFATYTHFQNKFLTFAIQEPDNYHRKWKNNGVVQDILSVQEQGLVEAIPPRLCAPAQKGRG